MRDRITFCRSLEVSRTAAASQVQIIEVGNGMCLCIQLILAVCSTGYSPVMATHIGWVEEFGIPIHFLYLSLELRYLDPNGEFNSSAALLIAEALMPNRIVDINHGELQLFLENIICSEKALTLEYGRHHCWTRRSTRHRLHSSVRKLQGSNNASYTDRKACAIFARGIPGQARL